MKKSRLVLGGGCFWCVEAIYSNVKGVISALSAYTGGLKPNPSYENICTGITGHAEVVDIFYDSEIISQDELLEIFFVVHNPTTLNSQGADKGTQYRSVIYYENDKQKSEILNLIQKEQEGFSEKIVTEVSELGVVFETENYHQNYYAQNSSQGYCQAVISPKLQKFMTRFPDKLA